MNNTSNKFLSCNQITALLIAIAIGPGSLKLANILVLKLQQDAWISSIIALLNPLYMILVSSYIIKKYPNDNILSLSNQYFGNTFGNLLNLCFSLMCTIYISTVTSDLVRFSRIYFVSFLSPLKVVIVCITLTYFAVYKGLSTLAKICEISMYLLIFITIFSLSSLKYGSILNIQPVFSLSLKDILKGSILTAYSYSGFEYLLIFHPFAKDTSTIKKASLKAVLISGFIWVWSVFSTIYYLGIDIIPKSLWAYILVFESINVPLINNFRYIFMFVWCFIVFRINAVNAFISSFILNHVTKIDINKILLFLYFLSLILSLQFVDVSFYKKVIDLISPILFVFNVIYVSSIALMVLIKGKNTLSL
ncbi:GerAB/ArcD/ProY family transporter [Clostridium sp. ZS2-4]|uniref:GerAB/ArcD/ProY family transporter n=1 Tax=Clostridium sp. ZS2-4 TaxID=2987703 RepID=UPI00227B1EEA|nr:GerAB/ArcD/ProY family transporter [Clostridium sp. ZS2-4]MCY6355151.1 GerAB/ArcD/ProY family transporter [Clostridium sp. ZS2-4]